MRRGVWVRVVVVFVGVGCAPVPPEVEPLLALDGDPQRGASIYADFCARCHGADASGGTGPALGAGSRADVLEATCLGIPPEMPAYCGTLTDQEIVDVEAWLRER